MKARKAKQFPRQPQSQPGHERPMKPKPESRGREYRAANKLERKVALITGGDSGIGRAVAVAFAKEGADVAIVYLEEHEDARETKRLVEAEGRRCINDDAPYTAGQVLHPNGGEVINGCVRLAGIVQ